MAKTNQHFDFPGSWIYDWDSFQIEAERLQQDVHMLILVTLDAGNQHLRQEVDKNNEKIEQYSVSANGEAAERLAEDQASLWVQLEEQQVFLRNQALVALISRLTHSLRKMLRSAESWSPRDPNGYEGRDEFKTIWMELRKRFDLSLGPRYIQWVEPYRRARNRIVHNGGEANVERHFSEIDPEADFDEGFYDTTFSRECRVFVSGTGSTAQVNVTEKLLDHAVEKSIQLVQYVAEQLRAKELEHARKEGEEFRARRAAESAAPTG
jgi:hypothetical protein